MGCPQLRQMSACLLTALPQAGHWINSFDISNRFASSLTGGGYTYSTVIAAALYYAGVELDKTRGSRQLDLVTPKQTVTSKGRFTTIQTSRESQDGCP